MLFQIHCSCLLCVPQRLRLPEVTIKSSNLDEVNNGSETKEPLLLDRFLANYTFVSSHFSASFVELKSIFFIPDVLVYLLVLILVMALLKTSAVLSRPA